MSPEQIRIEALRLALPRDVPANYDVDLYLSKARAFEAYILGPLANQPQDVVMVQIADKPKRPAKPKG